MLAPRQLVDKGISSFCSGITEEEVSINILSFRAGWACRNAGRLGISDLITCLRGCPAKIFRRLKPHARLASFHIRFSDHFWSGNRSLNFTPSQPYTKVVAWFVRYHFTSLKCCITAFVHGRKEPFVDVVIYMYVPTHAIADTLFCLFNFAGYPSLLTSYLHNISCKNDCETTLVYGTEESSHGLQVVRWKLPGEWSS